MVLVKQMKGDSTSDTKQLDNDLRDLKGNLAKATNELGNVIRVHAKGGGISDSEVLTNMIKEQKKLGHRSKRRYRRWSGSVKE